MSRIRASLFSPRVQLVLVIVGTVLVMLAGYWFGFTEWLAANIAVNTPGHDLADLGPGLLVLSSGLGVITYQRWRESDLEHQRAATAHDELAKSRERYRALAENTQDIVFFADTKGRILDSNRAATLRYGYTPDELRHMTVWDLRTAGSDRPAGVDLTKVPGDTARFDTVHATKGGGAIELSITAQRVIIGGEEIVMSVCRDVTEKRLAERELRSSETRYRSLTELSPSPVVVYDTDRTIVFTNQALLDLVRARDATQVVGHSVNDFVHAGSVEAARLGREVLEREGSTPFHDMQLVRIDGTTVAVQVATSRTTFKGQDAFHGVLQDVSLLMGVAENLRRTTEGTIAAMASLAECRDPYTAGHQGRVSAMAVRIATQMGLSEAQLDATRLAGVVHDIGKMNVPAEILSKPGKLTEPEFALIKEHAQRGYELLKPIDFPWPIAEIVREHHERLDGSGYPRGISDGDICIEARVLAVADTVEAISSDRPYRPSLGLDHAIDVIREGRGVLYDEGVVDAALALVERGELVVAGE